MKKQEEQAIGFFDSGIGGTSIWKELHQLLPFEDTYYLADSKNAPYGLRSRDEIIALSEKNTELLLNLNCKIIVVACNTATTNAIEHLRKKHPVPFIGIEPAIKPASLKTQAKAIGILATKGTLSSSLFLETSSIYSKGITVVEQEGTGIVELIEAGKIDSNEMRVLLSSYLEPMLAKNIDYLVLGCSHYPYLIPLLRQMLPNEVNIIDSGLAAAVQTKAILEKMNLLNQGRKSGKCEFFTNGNPAVLKNVIGETYPIVALEF